ncbi:MAG: glycosyltransferase family 2 protein [Cytophagaceae bacterium]|jgi:glycosyltransferase involved in cell wall biosynthesis|nr:glycosyltransferase family 2 protein [Cytophagaceae bacterium]
MNLPVSAVLITFNEAEGIQRCIDSLQWCDEIIVIDSGSTDATVSICEAAGCTVLHQPFLGFGEQKRFAVAQARHHWVLSIDADEVCTPALAEEIRKLLRTTPTFDAYALPRQLFFYGRAFTYGRESKQYQIRLFDRSKTNFNSSAVHEKVDIESFGKLSNVLLHYSYKDLHHYFEKFNTYTSKGADVLAEKGKHRSPILIFLFFPWYFFKFYILERNFLNGFAGWVWASVSTFYVMVKYSKHHETRSAKGR